MSAFTHERRAQILDALRQASATLPCPRCGHTHFSLVDGYLIENLQKQTRNVVVSGDNRFTSIVMTCDRCGYMARHALDVLDGHD
jgi:predicted nucleic-acid-binding Zn-ribbon protein